MKILTLIFFTLLLSASAFCKIPTDSFPSEKAPERFWSRTVLDIGLNQLQNIPSPLALNAWRSKGVNLYYYKEFRIIQRKLTLNPGIGLGLDNYSFSNDIVISTGNDHSFQYHTDTLKRDILKTKLAANYVDIPLELRYSTKPNDPGAFRVAIGAKAGVLFNAHSKIKYVQEGATHKSKERDDFGVNQFRYGIIGRLGFSYFNIFGYYSLSDFFDKGKGPNAVPIMFGITLSDF
ncbi:MAG: porin family protein [Cytophagaceae bacterium]